MQPVAHRKAAVGVGRPGVGEGRDDIQLRLECGKHALRCPALRAFQQAGRIAMMLARHLQQRVLAGRNDPRSQLARVRLLQQSRATSQIIERRSCGAISSATEGEKAQSFREIAGGRNCTRVDVDG
jgi:hypothetical protein